MQLKPIAQELEEVGRLDDEWFEWVIVFAIGLTGLGLAFGLLAIALAIF